jgi:hypothetical protein
VIAAAVVLVIVIANAGGSDDDGSSTAASGSQSADDALPTPVDDSVEPEPEESGFGNGTYRLGSDMPAGTYRSSEESSLCYWARLSGFGGTIDDIIANGNNSPEIVTVAASDAGFETQGCGTWKPVEETRPSAALAEFTDGTFEVGHYIAPGSYRADGSPDTLCYWARLSSFDGGVNGIIANGNSPTVVDISPSDAGFTSFGCGTWTQ